MQPNMNNTGVGNMPGAANMPSTSAAGDVVLGNQPRKKNKGMVIGMAVLAVLAAGGIGFGVWAVLDKNQESANLNNQIADLNSQLVEQQAVAEVDEDATIEADLVSNPTDYIYISDWNLKIKIPEGLAISSYKLNLNTFCISGVSSGHDKTYPDFSLNDKNSPGLGCITRSWEQEPYPDTKFVYSYEDNGATINLAYSRPQVLYSVDENEKNWETESIELVANMLSTPENYSFITEE